MKKTIGILLALTGILFALASCDNSPAVYLYDPNPHSINIPFNELYSSIEELYQGLLDESENLDGIRYKETRYSDWRESKGIHKDRHLTEAELGHGIFGSFRKKLIDDEVLLFPYYQEEPFPLNAEQSIQVELHDYSTCYKSWIFYSGKIDNSYVRIGTMYFDPLMTDEANEKGASWLISRIDPDGYNVYNYKEHNKAKIAYSMGKWPDEWVEETRNTTAYEKMYCVGDRDALAMVIDTPRENLPHYITVHFVYDNILVSVDGLPEAIEAVLPHLTFREIHMPTGEPLRDTPGRAWSGE